MTRTRSRSPPTRRTPARSAGGDDRGPSSQDTDGWERPGRADAATPPVGDDRGLDQNCGRRPAAAPMAPDPDPRVRSGARQHDVHDPDAADEQRDRRNRHHHLENPLRCSASSSASNTIMSLCAAVRDVEDAADHVPRRNVSEAASASKMPSFSSFCALGRPEPEHRRVERNVNNIVSARNATSDCTVSCGAIPTTRNHSVDLDVAAGGSSAPNSVAAAATRCTPVCRRHLRLVETARRHLQGTDDHAADAITRDLPDRPRQLRQRDRCGRSAEIRRGSPG